MTKKLRETTNVCVEIMNSKRQVKENISGGVRVLKRGGGGLISHSAIHIPLFRFFKNAFCVVLWHKQTSLQSKPHCLVCP